MDYPNYNLSVIFIILFAATPILACIISNDMAFLTNAIQGLLAMLTIGLMHKMTKVEKEGQEMV
jgi:hypothetical protein